MGAAVGMASSERLRRTGALPAMLKSTANPLPEPCRCVEFRSVDQRGGRSLERTADRTEFA